MDENPERKITSVSKVLKFAYPMIWTRASYCTRIMTALAFFSLISSRVVKVFSPIALKYAVDALTVSGKPISAIT